MPVSAYVSGHYWDYEVLARFAGSGDNYQEIILLSFLYQDITVVQQ
jgi:hypothetical protein